MKRKGPRLLCFLFLFCMVLNGCSLLTLPFQMLGTVAGLAGEAVSLAGSLPTPPPWVFF
jgi:hypothetical protein